MEDRTYLYALRVVNERHPTLLRENGFKYGSKAGKRTHELHPEHAQVAGSKGGRKGSHMRWHVSRGIASPGCGLCQIEKGGMGPKEVSVLEGPSKEMSNV